MPEAQKTESGVELHVPSMLQPSCSACSVTQCLIATFLSFLAHTLIPNLAFPKPTSSSLSFKGPLTPITDPCLASLIYE